MQTAWRTDELFIASESHVDTCDHHIKKMAPWASYLAVIQSATCFW